MATDGTQQVRAGKNIHWLGVRFRGSYSTSRTDLGDICTARAIGMRTTDRLLVGPGAEAIKRTILEARCPESAETRAAAIAALRCPVVAALSYDEHWIDIGMDSGQRIEMLRKPFTVEDLNELFVSMRQVPARNDILESWRGGERSIGSVSSEVADKIVGFLNEMGHRVRLPYKEEVATFFCNERLRFPPMETTLLTLDRSERDFRDHSTVSIGPDHSVKIVTGSLPQEADNRYALQLVRVS